MEEITSSYFIGGNIVVFRGKILPHSTGTIAVFSRNIAVFSGKILSFVGERCRIGEEECRIGGEYCRIWGKILSFVGERCRILEEKCRIRGKYCHILIFLGNNVSHFRGGNRHSWRKYCRSSGKH